LKCNLGIQNIKCVDAGHMHKFPSILIPRSK
jgi:hypothetical protein